MPTKYQKSQTIRERGTGKLVTTNYYIKVIIKQDLFKEINSDRHNKKRRAKCIRELERRGVKIQWTTKDKESIV